MVFKKRYAKKNYKKSSWYNKKYSTLDLARKAWAATRYLKGLVNSEVMHLDNTLTLGAAQSQIFPITNLAQGDLPSNRTGNSILLKNIYIRGTIQINTLVTGNTRVCLMLVKDKQQVSDTTPSITDIVTSSTDPDTLLQTNTFGRFKVLWRKNYALTPVSGGRNVLEITKYWKTYDHVRYNGTASTDIQRNGYYFIMITSENANYPTSVFNCRIGYHDN